ncbi:MAG: tripartite tricarboxylate transporter permease [Nanoarchaeota archaeon]|nr:tripartite tricarboxylate transporter permease [Nanoarchaeota archaeon]
MLIEIIFFIALGILFGTFTGLIPGIHTNLISTIILSLSTSILFFLGPIYLIVLISSMAIAHTFISFIPSVFLGCPDTDTELSVLPGHELLKKGQGYEAILFASYGGLVAMIILILIALPSFKIIPSIHNILLKNISLNLPLINEVSLSILASFLILISILLLSLEKKRFAAFIVFSLSGILGLSVLNMNVKEPLLPLLTGLFGASMLIMTLKTKTEIPQQNITEEHPHIRELKKSLASAFLGSLVVSPMLSLLPGLGSGQAAIIGDTFSRRIKNLRTVFERRSQDRETDQKEFLVLLGATNTLVMGFSFIALYLVSRTRTGAAAAIEQIAGNFSFPLFVLVMVAILISGITSFFITLFLAKHVSKRINSISYIKLSWITLITLLILVMIISGFKGVAVLITATITGIYCISLGVRRTNMMGCLLLPTIIFYLRI